MRHTITPQLVCHYCPGFVFTQPQYSFEESFGGPPVAATLQEDIDDFPVLIDGSSQIVLHSIKLDEHFIDVESVPKALVAVFQTPSIFGPKLVAPQPDRFITYDNAALGQQVFDISVAEIESVIKPNSVLNNYGWESIAFVRIIGPTHSAIVT